MLDVEVFDEGANEADCRAALEHLKAQGYPH